MADQVRAAGAAITACTIVARNYLPAARVLARSYLHHHPGHRFVVGVIDADDVSREAAEASEGAAGFEIVGYPAFGIDTDTYLRMATAYSVTELATAAKPYLMQRLRREHEVVLYLDPDVQVFAPMPELADLAKAHSIVLVPHLTKPLPRDGMEPDDAAIMGSGIFNLGFLAVGPGSDDFLEFWAGRLRHDAIVAPEKQLFTDQRWVDQVPALFQHTVLTDPGFDVAYWNLHEREVARRSADGGGAKTGSLTVNGLPLRFFHFSGYRPEKPWLLTQHTPRKPRVLLSDQPVVRELCDAYGAALTEAGYAETLDAVPYGFARLRDGTKLSMGARRLFREAWIAAERDLDGKGKKPMPPHAFGPDGGAALCEWLTAPDDHAQAAAGLNRIALAVWRSRTDLQLAFPNPTDADADAFRAWCETSGIDEGELPEWALPADEPTTARPPEESRGVNILGYLTAELGVGEMGRIVHDAIVAAGVQVTSVLEERTVANRTGVAHPKTTGDPRFPVTIMAVNADQTRAVQANHPDAVHDRYRIGVWSWELEDFPEWMHAAYELVDEVWTISEFCRQAIAAHTTIPVRTIPVPVRDPGPPAKRQREAGDPVRFLFAFDFLSVAQRKNPQGTVTAFQRAFPDRDDVRLVLKTINAKRQPHEAERLRLAVADDPRIELIEHYLSTEELHELYDSIDCYVSLHRSEGFGLTVAEAMARALPVISTDYSGTKEFVDEGTGWPIPYRLVSVGDGNYPYPPDAKWAEPDLDAAAAAMRQVADDPAEARRRGQAAREHVRTARSMTTASEWFGTELERAYETWLARRTQAPAGPPPDHPLAPLQASKEALRWRPETGSASRLPLAPAFRKAVLRIVDHYDVHQRKVQGALTEGTEATLSMLLQRIEALEAGLGETNRFAKGVARNVTENVESIGRIETDLARSTEQTTQSVEQAAKWSVAEFHARDLRLDKAELQIQRTTTDLGAVLDAARLLHAPVPEDADVVVCDAGVLVLPADAVMLPWLREHRWWEQHEAALLARLAARRPGAFLDLGAHVGYHSLNLLRTCPTVTKVIAVEADPFNAGLLRRNVARNLSDDAAERVHVLDVAAWDTDTELLLTQADQDNSGDHRVREVTERGTGTRVPAVRLDGVADVTQQPISLVKTDLQGRDHRALAGLRETLERDRPDVVCEFSPEAIEELGDDPAEVLRTYRKRAFRISAIRPDGTLADDESDGTLIEMGRAGDTDFVTLWLQS